MIPGAIHIPLASVALEGEQRLTDKSKPIYIYCASGVRSLVAAKILTAMGYQTFSVSDGYKGYAALSAHSPNLASNQAPANPRYARQTVLTEVGHAVNSTLQSKVLLVGVGGIGSVAAYYLAAAGVGTIIIVDGDQVEESNLHRQILYRDEDIGKAKVEVAANVLKGVNPKLNLIKQQFRFDRANGIELVNSGSMLS